ncbi:MAG TPA: bleomycin resistance family protein [Polyangiaceae bacterium]|jgi:catechol 2,3-dioxygenase-like lactoylglutathione lyase family enzyme|nr:bleomycin resistance family protein [Polyangiaceae bacterium]
MSIQHIAPILYASDFARTLSYFVDQLGFRKLWDWGEPPGFGAVARDKIEIFLCQGGQGAPGTWLSVFVEDVDALYEEFRAKGAVIPAPPKDEPWGMREMHVECPDGHILRFGHGIPSAPERVIERRTLPARIETRLAAVLEDLAAQSRRTVGELLEEIVLHSFERVEGKDGTACASPHSQATFRLIETLKQKHGIDYDTHANYGFVEKKPDGGS